MRTAGHNFRRHSTTRQGRCSGFTLPEVLATMVLMGIVLPVVMSGMSAALAASSRARSTAQAATLGETKLSELIATSQWSSASGGGDFGPDWPGYRWECQTVTRDYGATEIVLKVTWQERGTDRSLLVSTMAYDNTLTMGTSQ
ncbi:MAG: type II secretion system protein [Tepidisphaeraceae bacterium]|jgi:prepilin-type N-terminal cleavage/methylation domain-containing protein